MKCKFGLNNKVVLEKDPTNRKRSSNTVEIDDCQFHQSVKLDSDCTISFIPSNGEFKLMRYRTSDFNLPFKVHPVVTEIGKSKIEYRIVVKANVFIQALRQQRGAQHPDTPRHGWSDLFSLDRQGQMRPQR
ncbi:AP-2 complex subunit mu [Dissophora globulifera]|uniref:AP-2 complex subunit mu n=1 Tax=Dissophora globulifera TaxID=979702 RepID=A0A9P6UMJ1_9FUNG|nr:AP-2 complex subunit mu [Dissophora globulifera]